MSKPRAATSVQMRNLISPDLKADKFVLRSSIDFAPPKTAQEYAEVCTLAALSNPHLFKKIGKIIAIEVCSAKNHAFCDGMRINQLF